MRTAAVLFMLAAVAGCATPKPTDATASAIDSTAAHVTAAERHVGNALELNATMQTRLEALRVAK